MNIADNRNKVINKLQLVADRIRAHRAIVLTESDLKCQIYSELIQVSDFGAIQETADENINSIAVHTETKFFNSLGLLSKTPDIVITDPRRLSIRRRLDGDLLPSKGFHFDGSSILIELKFHRFDRSLRLGELSEIEKDIKKGIALNSRSDLDFHLFVVSYDRFGKAQQQVSQLYEKYMRQANTTLLYFN